MCQSNTSLKNASPFLRHVFPEPVCSVESRRSAGVWKEKSSAVQVQSKAETLKTNNTVAHCCFSFPISHFLSKHLCPSSSCTLHPYLSKSAYLNKLAIKCLGVTACSLCLDGTQGTWDLFCPYFQLTVVKVQTLMQSTPPSMVLSLLSLSLLVLLLTPFPAHPGLSLFNRR